MENDLKSNPEEVDVERRETVSALWWETVLAVAARWNRSRTKPWLDPETDLRLQEAIGESLRSGDLARAERAIAAWRGAWEQLLDEDTGVVGDRQRNS